MIELDMGEVSPTIEVRLLGLRRFRWRLQVAFWMLDLTRLVAPFDLVFHKDVGESILFYCPFCGKNTATVVFPRKVISTNCNHCGRQSVGRVEGAELILLHHESCDFECDVAMPYGFVPEAGCPVHDP